MSPNGFFALYSPSEKWAISHNWGQRDGMMLHCCCQEEMGTTYIFRMQSHKTLHDDVVVVLWCIQDCMYIHPPPPPPYHSDDTLFFLPCHYVVID